MVAYLIDSNVLIDIATRDQAWFHWSARALSECSARGRLAINPVIYAEVSMGFERIEELNAALPAVDYARMPIPWSAAFLAGRCFLTYRRRGGARAAPLPDFYIGAHAAVSGLVLVTRDPKRFRTYFPTVSLVAPTHDDP